MIFKIYDKLEYPFESIRVVGEQGEKSVIEGKSKCLAFARAMVGSSNVGVELTNTMFLDYSYSSSGSAFASLLFKESDTNLFMLGDIFKSIETLCYKILENTKPELRLRSIDLYPCLSSYKEVNISMGFDGVEDSLNFCFDISDSGSDVRFIGCDLTEDDKSSAIVVRGEYVKELSFAFKLLLVYTDELYEKGVPVTCVRFRKRGISGVHVGLSRSTKKNFLLEEEGVEVNPISSDFSEHIVSIYV